MRSVPRKGAAKRELLENAKFEHFVTKAELLLTFWSNHYIRHYSLETLLIQLVNIKRHLLN